MAHLGVIEQPITYIITYLNNLLKIQACYNKQQTYIPRQPKYSQITQNYLPDHNILLNFYPNLQALSMQPQKFRIVAMSDTHDSHSKIDVSQLPPGDIFIHAGDFTQNSFRGEIDRFVQFLKQLPYKHKIVIAGNHDFVLDHAHYQHKHKPKRHPYEKMKSQVQIQKLKAVCTYLDHEEVQIEGLRIFGSPYQPLFFNWGFQYHQTRAHEIWQALPQKLDILVTHGPPYGILDCASDGTHAGCKTLAEKVKQIKPKVHIFGHLHHSSGETEIDGVKYCNVAMMDEAYQVVHAARVIEIDI